MAKTFSLNHRSRRSVLNRRETLILENALDGAQPIRTLRMSGRHNMIEAGRVTDQKG